MQVLLDDFVAGVASEDPMAGEHTIEHSPQRVYIGVGINRFVEKLLRRGEQYLAESLEQRDVS